MRQGPNSRRARGRNNGRRHVPSRHQSVESNGPDVKVRGNPSQVLEKYLALARDANSAGDRIAAEGYYQHAEHYFRLLNRDDDEARRKAQGGGNRSGQATPANGGESDPQPETDALEAGQDEAAESDQRDGQAETARPRAPERARRPKRADSQDTAEAEREPVNAGGEEAPQA